jgi:hypothetical protein
MSRAVRLRPSPTITTYPGHCHEPAPHKGATDFARRGPEERDLSRAAA